MAKKGKLSNKLILFGRDLIKGYVTKKQYSNYFSTLSPWQMVSLEEKTKEWFMWNADWFEAIGLQQVNKDKGKILRNRRMAMGILDPNDYIPRDGEFSHLSSILIPEDSYDPLQQFYPLAPPVINVIKGEFEKRDFRVQIECIDSNSINEKIQYKTDLVNKAVMEYEQGLKQNALKNLGIQQIPEDQLKNASQEQIQQLQQMNQQFQNEMELNKKLIEAEQKYRTHKHRMEEWAQHILNVDAERFRIDELEVEAFVESLCNAKEFWHIDLLEDDYKLEFLDTANCFWHKSPSIKYISEGDYFGWFEDMTIGDVINKLGKRLKDDDFDKIKSFLNYTMNQVASSAMLTDDQKAFSDAYYDTSEPYPFGAKNIGMERIKERMYWEDFMKSNFENNSSFDAIMGQFNNVGTTIGQPKIFKVVRFYWRSQKQIGWLTRIGKDGVPQPGIWIDENYKVTEKPIYDNTITKENTKENLVYGEHIDWEWVNEWRHGIKIAQNHLSTYWKNNTGDFEPIYIDGEPVKFQFKGKDNIYESFPPVEGCEYSMKGVRAVSLVDLLAPSQITYNICQNKKAGIIVRDMGKLLAHNQATIPRDRPGHQVSQDIIADYYDQVAKTKILSTSIDKEVMQMLGQNANMVPQVVDMSIIPEAILYSDLANRIKEEAFETIGITRQRLGQQKASETATGITGAVNYSEVQTEPLFTQHSINLMPRVYQRLLEAAQYYLYQNKTSKIVYRNSEEENILMEVENYEGLLRDYNIRPVNKPVVKQIKQKLEKLFLEDNTLEASALDRAEVITSNSVVEILSKLKKAQAHKELLDEQKMQHEQEMQQKQIDAEREKLEIEIANTNEQNELDRKSAEKIAMLRQLSGIQTDANANTELDSQENLDYYLKQQQMIESNDQNSKKLEFEKQKHSDSMTLERQKLLAKLETEDKKLQVAKQNKNKYDK